MQTEEQVGRDSIISGQETVMPVCQGAKIEFRMLEEEDNGAKHKEDPKVMQTEEQVRLTYRVVSIIFVGDS